MNFENDSASITLAWDELSRSLCKEHGYHRVGGFNLPTKTAWACYEPGGPMLHIDFLTGEPLYDHGFAQVKGFSEGLACVRNADYQWTHHILPNSQPAYGNRFQNVGRFFEGLADAQDETGSFHITPKGEPAYKKRFISVGHFSQGVAVARDESGCFHIYPDGKSLYKVRNFVSVGPFEATGEAIAWAIFQLQNKDGEKRRVILSTRIDRRGRILKKRKGFTVVRPTNTDIDNYRRKTY